MSQAKRNRQIEYMNDNVKRRNMKCKRTKGIIKKAYELSVLCKLDINISFFDPSLFKVIEYTSNPNFTMQDLNNLRIKGKKKHGEKGKELNYKLMTTNQFLDTSFMKSFSLNGGSDD